MKSHRLCGGVCGKFGVDVTIPTGSTVRGGNRASRGKAARQAGNRVKGRGLIGKDEKRCSGIKPSASLEKSEKETPR